MRKNQERLESARRTREDKVAEEQQELQLQHERQAQQDSFNQGIHKKRTDFLESFRRNDHGVENLNPLCEHIQEFVGATGFYVVRATHQIRLAEEEDPLGTSLKNEEVPSLRFVASNSDHEFLLKSEHDVHSLT